MDFRMLVSGGLDLTCNVHFSALWRELLKIFSFVYSVLTNLLTALGSLVYAGDHAGGECGPRLAEDEPAHRLALGVQLYARRPLKLDKHERAGVRAQAARLGGGGLALLVQPGDDLAQGRAAAARVAVRLQGLAARQRDLHAYGAHVRSAKALVSWGRAAWARAPAKPTPAPAVGGRTGATPGR